MEEKTAAVEVFKLPSAGQVAAQITEINQFQRLVHQHLVDGQDYGVIPGTPKPTLLKPGAEKITKLLGLADTYEIVKSTEDWDKPLFRYLIKCSLHYMPTGAVISEGLGECNSMESKYRWRDSGRKCPTCGKEAIIKGKAEYGGGWLCYKNKGGCGAKYPDGDQSIEGQTAGKIPNDDIYSQVNTILKMAEKRSLVDAALHAGRLSDIFTQDIDDFPDTVKAETQRDTPATTPKPQASQPGGKVEAQGVNLKILRDLFPKLHWTDGTAQSWIEFQFKVTRKGTLEETINLLTQEQKDKFVHYVSNSAANG